MSAVVTPVFVERKTCRSCDSKTLVAVLDLGDQYLSNFVDRADSSLPRAPLELVRCADCGLLQLLHTADRDLMYRDYWYRSSVNQTMKDALADVVLAGMQFRREGYWLDIGANDGYLLSQVPSSFYRIACEPADNFHEELGHKFESVIPTYFSNAELDGRKCDVVTSAAMFYDLDDPNRFVDDIRKSLAPDGVWINQLSDSPTIWRRTPSIRFVTSTLHTTACRILRSSMRDTDSRSLTQLGTM